MTSMSHLSSGNSHPAPHLKAQAEGRRLFIGGLNYETTDQSLQAYLATRWPIEEVRVKRFPDGNSRGFGFATFISVGALEECFNASPHWVDGKQVEMRKVGLDGASNGFSGGQKRSLGDSYGGPPKNRVFIGPPAGQPRDRGEGRGQYGLNDDISDDDLRSFFMHFGVVTEIRQHRWEDSGRKKGFGYIEFHDEEAADAACGIHKVLGVMLEVKPYSAGTRTGGGGGGMRSSGSNYTPSAKRARGEPRDPEDEVMRKLFVGNMNVISTKETVEEYFQNFGELENVYCPTGKGYAFLTFKYASGIDAVQRARPHKVDDRLVDTKRSTPKEFAGIPDMEARSKKLYISGARSYGEEAVGHSGLTDDITDNDLEQYFSQYGTVTSIDQKVWPDTGKKRGYGYIEFDDEDAVDKIVLLGIHIIGGARMEARKGLSKEQQEAIRNGQVRTQGKLAQRAAENAGGYGYGGARNDGMADSWGGGYGGHMGGGMGGPGQANGGGMQNMQQMQQMMQQMQNMQTAGQGGESVGQMQQMMMSMMKMQMQMMMGSAAAGAGNGVGGHNHNQRDPNYVAPPLPSEPYPKSSYGSRGGSYGSSRY